MGVLARQSRERSILVTTTTHMYPMTQDKDIRCLLNPGAEELVAALLQPGIVCAGRAAEAGKITALPEEVLQAGIAAADVILYEADGSRQLPLKLHRAGEPVLLPETTKYLVVAGLSALGQAVSDAVHCHGLAPELGKTVGPQEVVHCVMETVDSIGCRLDQVRVFLNQEDSCRETDAVGEIKEALGCKGLPVESGSLWTPPDALYDWIVSG